MTALSKLSETARRHPYEGFVQRVEKPARYLGGEHGAVIKNWNDVDAKVCLAFPDIYDIGMSHLGFKILYKVLNDHPRTLAERCYTPWIDMQKELRERQVPLVSLESARPLSDFDVVGFSLQFELTYTNVLAMLELGGIALRSDARGEDAPLVLAGGPTATHPEPIAPFMDAIVIGDGEQRATDIALLWTSLKKQGVSRSDRLRALTKLEGVYVPSLYATETEAQTGQLVLQAPSDTTIPFPVGRALIANLDDFPFPDDGPVGGPEAIFDRMSIEIARGCTEGCRFCQAGMIYRPVRERDPAEIVETVARAVKKSGYDEVSLTCLSTADYSCIAPLIQRVTERLANEKVSLGVSSLRAYGLEESVLDDMQRVRANGVTFAPEAGSQRMRDVVNKNVTEEQLMTTAERIFSRGYTSMKLYFMIGLPTEDESDVREIAKVGGRAREVGRQIKRTMGEGPPKVTVSVSTHVPKPHTPFQWCAMDAPEDVRQKQRWIKEEAKYAKVDLRMHDSETSWLEGVFARGDRKLANVLERAYKNGARFDSWEECLRLDVWEKAFADEGVVPGAYLGTLPVTARLPWDHIDVGLEDGFLLREYRKAVKSRLSVPCGKVAGMFIHHTNLQDAESDVRKLVCYDCGVACDMTAMREERLVFLRRLGAEIPRKATPAAGARQTEADEVAAANAAAAATENRDVAEDAATERAPQAPAKRKGKAPPPKMVQGEPRRYRFTYTKLGPSAFLSHLDLIRALPRSFRRLELPMYYSSGFHPKPDMMFGPALSLGVASLGEVIDVKLTADIDPEAILEALTEASPAGIVFTGGVKLGATDQTISKLVTGAEYAVAIPRKVLGEGGEAKLSAAAATLLAKTEAKILRRIEGVGKWVDVRALLSSLVVGDERATRALAEAGFMGDFVAVHIGVKITQSGAAKVGEVMQAIFEGHFEADLPFQAVRTRLGFTQESRLVLPLALTELRA